MKYVLLICDDESEPIGPEQIAADPVHQRWLAEAKRAGVFLGGERLRPVADATTVRVRNGETLISDGPFAETKDLIGGYVLIDCKDLDQALEVAAGHPFARHGTVEVRPVWEA